MIPTFTPTCKAVGPTGFVCGGAHPCSLHPVAPPPELEPEDKWHQLCGYAEATIASARQRGRTGERIADSTFAEIGLRAARLMGIEHELPPRGKESP